MILNRVVIIPKASQTIKFIHYVLFVAAFQLIHFTAVFRCAVYIENTINNFEKYHYHSKGSLNYRTH